MAYVYGTYYSRNGSSYKFRAFLNYTASETDTTYSLAIFSGIQCNTSNDVGNSGFTVKMTGTSQTDKSKTSQTYYTSQADSSQRKTIFSSYTWTWNKTSVSQDVTIKCAVSASGMTTSTATYSFTIPALAITTYTVTYNANGGSNPPAPQTKEDGVDLTLTDNVPFWLGYEFKNWNTLSNGTGTTYASGATYSTNADITLYAQWEEAVTPSPTWYEINKIKYNNDIFNITPSNASTGNGYGTATALGGGIHSVTIPGYELTRGGIVSILFPEGKGEGDLNINGLGNKTIYYRGVSLSSYADTNNYSPIEENDLVTFVYDGNYFHIISIDKERDVKKIKHYYEAGDTIFFGQIYTNCVLTNSRKDIRFSLGVDLPIVCEKNINNYPNANKVIGYSVADFGQFYIMGYPNEPLSSGTAASTVSTAAFQDQTNINNINPSYLTFFWRQSGNNVWSSTSSYNNREWTLYIADGEVILLGEEDIENE